MYNKIIKSDDNKALTQLMENKDFFVKRNEYMQSVNDYYKENGTVVGFPDMEDDTAKNLNARVSKDNPAPYPQSFFKENQYQINRIDALVDRISNKPETLFKGWEFEGGEAVVNLSNSRLQLMFAEKPSEEIRKSLLKNGFKFAPTTKAWQRPLSSKTFSVCDKLDFIKPKDGRTPSDIQPKIPKKNEHER